VFEAFLLNVRLECLENYVEDPSRQREDRGRCRTPVDMRQPGVQSVPRSQLVTQALRARLPVLYCLARHWQALLMTIEEKRVGHGPSFFCDELCADAHLCLLLTTLATTGWLMRESTVCVIGQRDTDGSLSSDRLSRSKRRLTSIYERSLHLT